MKTASQVKVGDTIQHPGKQWPAREVLKIQLLPLGIRFTIPAAKAGETTGVLFRPDSPILIS